MVDARKDFREHHELWRNAFGDTEDYMEYYFAEKAHGSQVREDRENGRLCSMAFFTEYDALFRGRKCRLPYIVGVATREERRHEGRMTRILSEGIDWWQERKCPLVFLSPADPAIYDPLGFVPIYWRESTFVEGKGNLSLEISCWDELSSDQKHKVANFAEEQICEKNFDLHLVHHAAYYEEVHRELQALDGALLVFFAKKRIVGVANWICEDGKNEVTELICLPGESEKVVESLQAWVRGESLMIDDSMFLEGLNKKGMQKKRQEKPYIMCRSLLGEKLDGLRCYINDIT